MTERGAKNGVSAGIHFISNIITIKIINVSFILTRGSIILLKGRGSIVFT